MPRKFLLQFTIVGFFVFLISSTVSYYLFKLLLPVRAVARITNQITPAQEGGKKAVVKKPDLPKTEACPLNGAMYSKPEKDLWVLRRPLSVMVENSKVSRPQSGLSFADVVYEAVAEGGITRFMAVYYCQDAEFIGPVRSARTYFLDWASEYGTSPLYVHVGGANTPGPADALGQIERYGWAIYNDLNQFSVGFPTFWRDYERLGPDTATEHTVYSSTIKLWHFAANKRKLTNVEIDDRTGKEVGWDDNYVAWKFKSDVPLDQRPEKQNILFNFSNIQSSYLADYEINWQYDRNLNAYLRTNGGVSHQDLNTNQQLVAKNIILQFMSLKGVDDGYSEEGHGAHMIYGNKGTGKAIIIMDGKTVDGVWKKKDRTSKTLFYDAKGQEIKFNPGAIWIEALPIGQKIDVQ